MLQNFCCPHCGNKDLLVTTETNTQTKGSNYSGGKGCLGFLLFGPLGLLCGSCGKGKETTTTNDTYFVCSKCGKRFKHPDELRKEISSLQSLTAQRVIPSMVLALIVSITIIVTLRSAKVAFAFAAILISVSALASYLVKRMNDSARKKLEAELHELESSMNRFKDE